MDDDRNHHLSGRPQKSKLCDRCKVVEIDDKALGGCIKTSETGEEHVSFDVKGGLLDTLHYELNDTFPNLPLLSASASSGCALCSVIREKILEYTEKYQRTYLKLSLCGMRYRLQKSIWRENSEPWLEALLIIFKLDKGEEETLHALRFDLHADPTGTFIKSTSCNSNPVTDVS